jgi:hypothetical protein
MKWEKIFANHLIGVCLKYMRNFYSSIAEKLITLIKKWAKNSDRHSPKKTCKWQANM